MKKYKEGMLMIQWMLLFGIPIGVALSIALDNFAFIGAGIGIGIALGAVMEENAKKKGQIIKLTKKEKAKRTKLGWIGVITGLIIFALLILTFFLR